MAKRKARARKRFNWVAASLFLVGLSLLLEALGAGFILSQLPSSILGTSGSLIWLYIVVRLVAGLAALVVGAKELGK